MENNKEPILIIDTDVLNFTVCRVTEDITDFGDQICKSFDEEATIRLFEQGLKDIGDKTGYEVKNIFCALSSPTNFRKEHYPTYKGNRKDVVKPLGLPFLRQHLLDNADKYNTIMLKDLEGDDVMGIFGTSGDDSISIYSIDKDLYTIPIRQWDFKQEKFITPTELQSIHFLYIQVLTGDSVDGYKGCPKIGKVKATKALEGCSNELEMLRQCHVRFHKVYGLEAKCELLKQIGQARILHQLDYVALQSFNKTYNPYELMNVSQDMLEIWEQEYEEELIKAKKKPKKVKDVI